GGFVSSERKSLPYVEAPVGVIAPRPRDADSAIEGREPEATAPRRVPAARRLTVHPDAARVRETEHAQLTVDDDVHGVDRDAQLEIAPARRVARVAVEAVAAHGAATAERRRIEYREPITQRSLAANARGQV